MFDILFVVHTQNRLQLHLFFTHWWAGFGETKKVSIYIYKAHISKLKLFRTHTIDIPMLLWHKHLYRISTIVRHFIFLLLALTLLPPPGLKCQVPPDPRCCPFRTMFWRHDHTWETHCSRKANVGGINERANCIISAVKNRNSWSKGALWLYVLEEIPPAIQTASAASTRPALGLVTQCSVQVLLNLSFCFDHYMFLWFVWRSQVINPLDPKSSWNQKSNSFSALALHTPGNHLQTVSAGEPRHSSWTGKFQWAL